MKIDLTVYKNDSALVDGVKQAVETNNIAVLGQMYISTVDFYDVNVDTSRPHRLVTHVKLNGSDNIYVSETPDEIQALMNRPVSPTAGVQTLEFSVGGVDPNYLPMGSGNIVDWPAEVPDNAIVIEVVRDNITVYNGSLTFTGTRTVDWTTQGGLSDGMIVKLTYKPA